MTAPVLKIKVLAVPKIKGKMDIRFPANVAVEEFLTILKANGTYTFGVDYTLLDASPILDASTAIVAVYDETSGSYKVNTISQLLQQSPTVDQRITAPGPVTLAGNVGTVRVDQTVGAAITLNLPAAVNKTCPVLIADWKGDAGTNNITIVPNGTEKIQGRSSWTIAGDTGSVFLRPITGVGYAI
jgi:hypothetical protein